MVRKKPQRVRACLIENQASIVQEVMQSLGRAISIRKARFMAKQMLQGK